MTDRLTDFLDLSGVNYFHDDLRLLISDVIEDLYHSKYEYLYRLRLKHIDRAVFKYTQASTKREIYNTKQYFKACLVSAINELGIDELE